MEINGYLFNFQLTTFKAIDTIIFLMLSLIIIIVILTSTVVFTLICGLFRSVIHNF